MKTIWCGPWEETGRERVRALVLKDTDGYHAAIDRVFRVKSVGWRQWDVECGATFEAAGAAADAMLEKRKREAKAAIMRRRRQRWAWLLHVFGLDA